MLVAWTENGGGGAATLTVRSLLRTKCARSMRPFTRSPSMLQFVWATVRHNHIPCHCSVNISCNLGVSGGSVCARQCWVRKRMNTYLPIHMSKRYLTSAYPQYVKGHVGSGIELTQTYPHFYLAATSSLHIFPHSCYLTALFLLTFCVCALKFCHCSWKDEQLVDMNSVPFVCEPSEGVRTWMEALV